MVKSVGLEVSIAIFRCLKSLSGTQCGICCRCNLLDRKMRSPNNTGAATASCSAWVHVTKVPKTLFMLPMQDHIFYMSPMNSLLRLLDLLQVLDDVAEPSRSLTSCSSFITLHSIQLSTSFSPTISRYWSVRVMVVSYDDTPFHISCAKWTLEGHGQTGQRKLEDKSKHDYIPA